MPSITAYTPFETLKFCQSIAHHGANTSSFEEIAAALNANDLIREGETYDEKRLSPSALHTLYDNLLARERAGSAQINGDAAEDSSNPRKRKLSLSPDPLGEGATRSEEDLVNSLVEKLYARFREEAIKEIRKDEAEYEQLQNGIKELEAQIESASTQPDQDERNSTPPNMEDRRKPSRTDVSALLSSYDETPAYSRQGQEERLHEQSGSRPSSNGDGRPQTLPDIPTPVVPSQRSPGPDSSRPSAEPSQPPLPPNITQSPAAFNRTLPPPSPQRTSFGAAPHHGYPPGPQGPPVPILPPIHGVPPHMSPHMDYSKQSRSSSTSSPARGSPAPPPQQPYQGYPQYQQQHPPWPHQYPPPQQPYPQHMQYPNQGYYGQPPTGRPPYPPPHQSPYPLYPQPPPGHYPGPPQGWHPSPQHPPYNQPVPIVTTPLAQAAYRRSIARSSGSSTPWRRTPMKPGQQRPTSPTRPERDVSPLTDTEDEPKTERQILARASSHFQETPVPETVSKRSTRRGRPPSATPSRIPESRSQSIASQKSATPIDRNSTRRGGTAKPIKDEAPSTPVPSDTDQTRSTTRRGRPPKANEASTPRPTANIPNQKRKRSPPLPSSSTTPPASALKPPPPPPSAQPSHPHPHSMYTHDLSLVLVSKTFAKTSQLLLNEVTSHKLAGIFAKPLSERDAPGYRELILRAQDLKSIRSAVGRGGRAGVAAIEALESEKEDGTPMRSAADGKKEEGGDGKGIAGAIAGAGEGPLGNGLYLVSLAPDLHPPRGIVNSSQLELEVTRMFANAVMFNPLPTEERGFGRNLRLRENGGDLRTSKVPKKKGDDEETEDDDEEENDDGSGAEEGSESSLSEGDNGGIIADAREMFEDVVSAVRRWREVEVERVMGAGTGPASGSVDAMMARQGSVSISVGGGSVVMEDDTSAGVGVGTPTAALGDGEGGGVSVGVGVGRSSKRRRVGD